ncbi:MAG: hypothetical protein JST64_02405, partial [Actinobacteria bacterium]|nr:hypothetical protein [Actinomycetota bacterium]
MTDRTPRPPRRSAERNDATSDAPRVVRRDRTRPSTPKKRWPRRLLIGSVAVAAAVALVAAAGAAWGVWSINRVGREDLKLA